jgi:hypothetical protein
MSDFLILLSQALYGAPASQYRNQPLAYPTIGGREFLFSVRTKSSAPRPPMRQGLERKHGDRGNSDAAVRQGGAPPEG